MTSPKNIIFLHPDLGIGGAERLVVDAAIALKEKGHNVSFVTSYHNSEHCFEETKNGKLKVTVVGEWIPRNVMGRFFAFFAYFKMIYCALYIIFFEKPDLVFCDLISVCIPILQCTVKKVIFYCHYPDQLLSKKEGLCKKMYRMPLNWLEEKTINCADKIYVNSEFTKKVFKATFTSSNKTPTVLYPSINTKMFDNVAESHGTVPSYISSDNFVFLSINRYERKKYIEYALKAFIILKEKVSSNDWNKISLVIAGGYDPRVQENVDYYSDLDEMVFRLRLNENVILLKSPSDIEKVKLLNRCNCLIYTPPNEHFGIVPLEAMYCKKTVIACNSGGPTETIVDGITGFLCDLNPTDFANAMCKFIENRDLENSMGNQGHLRFIDKFSYEAFSNQLCDDVENMVGNINE